MDPVNHDLLREWGEIPPNVKILHMNVARPQFAGRPDYYVQQRRWGLYYPADLSLDRRGHPVFAIRREGVHLLRVFRFEEFVEAFRVTKDVPIPALPPPMIGRKALRSHAHREISFKALPLA